MQYLDKMYFLQGLGFSIVRNWLIFWFFFLMSLLTVFGYNKNSFSKGIHELKWDYWLDSKYGKCRKSQLRSVRSFSGKLWSNSTYRQLYPTRSRQNQKKTSLSFRRHINTTDFTKSVSAYRRTSAMMILCLIHTFLL